MYEIRDEKNETKHWASALDESDAPEGAHLNLYIVIDRKLTAWKLPLSGDAYEVSAIARMLHRAADKIDEIARGFVARWNPDGTPRRLAPAAEEDASNGGSAAS
jgi:hypothetical protein